MRTGETRYVCPFCGNVSKTHVVRTIAYRQCILRIRKCRICGKTHETIEVAFDHAATLKSASRRIAQRVAAGEVHPA